MIGDAAWFVGMERHFGGYVEDVPRTKFSPAEDGSLQWMIGGDRMALEHHGYAAAYARALAPMIRRRHDFLVVVECGILNGSGLALWSVLFPTADIIGLDIEPENFVRNLPHLKSLGAFKSHDPEIYEFDQLTATADDFAEIIRDDRKIDVMVDDAFHSEEAILRTYQLAHRHLAPGAVYFIEDVESVDLVVRPEVEQAGTLAIVRNGE
jgi:hypothetical protein